MDTIQFDGQQEGERVLYAITPNLYAMYFRLLGLFILALFFFFMLQLIASVAPSIVGLSLRIGSFVTPLLLVVFGVWWNRTVFTKSKTFITDRRIIRFEVMTPFFTTKRALFWNEALKAKGFASNIFWKSLNIGTVIVEPHLTENEDVRIPHVFMYDDVANYIDKILFIFKNKPGEVGDIKPFVARPKGQRDAGPLTASQ